MIEIEEKKTGHNKKAAPHLANLGAALAKLLRGTSPHPIERLIYA